MKDYVYENEIEILLKTVPNILKDDIYNFKGSGLENYFNEYYHFCIKNMREETNVFDIQPTFFYFRDDERVNAAAIRHLNKNSIIYVNKGVIVSLHKYFIKSGFFNQKKIQKRFQALQSVCDRNLAELMLQYSTLFTYYHELGHIIQKSDLLSNCLTENVQEYNPNLIWEKHLLEIDADLFAAYNIAQHICQYWESMIIKNTELDKGLLHDLIIISSASIQFYIARCFNSFVEPLYFEKYSHPHSSIRLLNILGTVNDYLKNQLGIDTPDIVQETIEISNNIIEYNEYMPLIQSWLEVIKPNLENILDYSRNIIDKFPDNPKLASNKILNLKNRGSLI